MQKNDMAVTTSLPGYLVKLQETSHQVFHVLDGWFPCNVTKQPGIDVVSAISFDFALLADVCSTTPMHLLLLPRATNMCCHRQTPW